jgi:NhaP-type Na+/H+ or K+/H+ antiporter
MAVLPELLIIEALVLAIILAPTDAALGQVVVSSPRVPERIRQSLNVESGVNDGIALPALLFVISFAAATHGNEHDTDWVSFVAQQLVLGPLAGILIGWASPMSSVISTCSALPSLPIWRLIKSEETALLLPLLPGWQRVIH